MSRKNIIIKSITIIAVIMAFTSMVAFGSAKVKVNSNVKSSSSDKGSKKTGKDMKNLNDNTAATLPQLTMPEKGEEVAVITTNKGVIKVKLFPQYAPLAVENFVKHAKEGYYDGLIFHRVINNFMIQGGDPEGNGTGGESIWGKPFKDEFSPMLHNFRGALSMANAGANTNGSQFFIVQNKKVEDSLIKQMADAGSQYFPKSSIEGYKKNGGTPWLDFKHTVFGQVYDGMDVVDNIAEVSVDSADKPVKDVVIKKVEIVKYK